MEILLIEDNPGDVRLTREGLRDGPVPVSLNVVPDGEEALRYLRREGHYTNSVVPDLVLLDLNLPKRDGREVLAEMKSDELLRKIPVIVLTTSMAEQDIRCAYELHANCYLQKPVELDRFLDLVHCIKEFWFTTVSLPPRTDPMH